MPEEKVEEARGVGVEVPPARVTMILLGAPLHARVMPVPLDVMLALVGLLAGALHVEMELSFFPANADVDGARPRGVPEREGIFYCLWHERDAANPRCMGSSSSKLVILEIVI